MQTRGIVIGAGGTLAALGLAFAGIVAANADDAPEVTPTPTVSATPTPEPEPTVEVTVDPEPVVEEPVVAAPEPAPVEPVPTFDPGGQEAEGVVTPFRDGSESVVLYPPNPAEG